MNRDESYYNYCEILERLERCDKIDLELIKDYVERELK